MTCVSDFSAGRLINVLQVLIHKEFFYHTAWIDTEGTDKGKKKKTIQVTTYFCCTLTLLQIKKKTKRFISGSDKNYLVQFVWRFFHYTTYQITYRSQINFETNFFSKIYRLQKTWNIYFLRDNKILSKAISTQDFQKK